jgi:peptide/nickel transport system substrate-binding protein
LERNPHWTGLRPHLDSIVFKVVPDESARILQLQIGEIDMVESVAPKDVVRLREQHPQIQLYELQPRMIGVLSYNLSRQPLDDQRVRQAISYSVDRRALIEGVIYGYAIPLATPILPMHAWAQHPDLAPYPRDVERARALLAEAGYADSDGDGIVERNGTPLRLGIRTRTGDLIRENGAVILQRNLRDIGIDAQVQMMELAATLDLVRQGDFDIYYGHSNVSVSIDLSDVYGTGGGFNYSGFSDAAVDSMMRAAVALEDRALARPYWLHVQEILYEQQPTSILYALKPLAAIHSRFRDCTPHMLSPWEGIERWWRLPDAAS